MVPRSTKEKRQPRFRREPKANVRLTARDLEILRRVAEHRYLNTDHLQALLDWQSRKTLNSRLRLLYDHGFLIRPKSQLEYYSQHGSRPMVYGLDSRGARALEQDGHGLPTPTGTTGRLHLEHALFVSDVLVALEVSARRHGADFLSFQDILAGSPAATLPRPDGWKVSIKHNRRKLELNLYPDAMFAVSGKRGPALLFLEADRGTEIVRPRKRTLARSSMYKKYLLYRATSQRWRDPKASRPYGFKYFRVLTVVSGKEPHKRVENLQELAQELAPHAPGLFLFATHDELVAGDLLAFEWENAAGEPVRLASS